MFFLLYILYHLVMTQLTETAEFREKVLRAARDNPDLPIDFIEGIFIALAEEASFEYVFD
jgi:hypothetical protein